MGFGTYEVIVRIKNGSSNTSHTVRLNAESVFAASMMAKAQYGGNNVLTIPKEINGSGTSNYDITWNTN